MGNEMFHRNLLQILTSIKNYFLNSTKYYFQLKMLAISVWAFAGGIPLLMNTATLSARLLQAGVPLIKIGLFAATTLPYSLKLFVSPFVERFSIPILNNYISHAKSWMIIGMVGSMLSIIICGLINPTSSTKLNLLFITAFMGCCCGALSDTAEAKLRIELLEKYELPIGNACYTNGFCLGELVAASMPLIIAGFLNWRLAYLLTAFLILLGIIAVICTRHTNSPNHLDKHTAKQFINSSEYLYKLRARLIIFYKSGIILPCKSLISYAGWYWILLIVIFYYATSYMLLMMSNPFYLQLGFTMQAIGAMRGIPGTILLILGGVVGGILCNKLGVMRILIICLCLYIFNALLQLALEQLVLRHLILFSHHISDFLFSFTILFCNLLDGISVVAYISLLAALCKPPNIVTQYALLTSIMACSKIVFSFLGGYLVKHFGWTHFFIILVFFDIPIALLIFYVAKINSYLELRQFNDSSNTTILSPEY